MKQDTYEATNGPAPTAGSLGPAEAPAAGLPPDDPRHAAGGVAPGLGAGAAPGAEGSPVTPLRPFSPIGELRPIPRVLSAGLDTADVGLYIEWDNVQWLGLLGRLEDARIKAQAAGDAVVWFTDRALGPVAVFPSGRKMYKHHLRTGEFDLWIQTNQRAGKQPNACVSFMARTLWTHGLRAAVERLKGLVDRLAGRVERVQMSRVDLTADLLLGEPLGFDELRAEKVSQCRALRPYLDGDRLETFYVGKGGSAMQARIYDKLREIQASGKWWMLEVWGLRGVNPTGLHVWRVEFQLRREALRGFGVDSVADLDRLASGLWRRLTEEWLSFRRRDNANVSRRTLAPWWAVARSAADLLPGVAEVERVSIVGEPMPADWYVRSIAGNLASYAAKQGLRTLTEAWRTIATEVGRYWRGRGDFEAEVQRRAVLKGVPVEVAASMPPF